MIALATVGFALLPLFGKVLSNAGLASSAITFYRYLFPTVLLLPALTFAGKKRSASFWAISAGVAVGLGTITYLDALKSMPVATVGVIYYTYPLFTLLIAALWLRQYPQRGVILGVLLTMMAAFIALSPASVGSDSLKSVILSLLTPLTFAYCVIVLSQKVTQLTPLERLVAYSLGSVIGVLPLILSLDSNELIPSHLTGWIQIFGMAMINYLIPQFLYVMAAPFVGSARAAVAGSLGLPTMFVIGWLAFGEQITLLQGIAGFLIVIAILITPAKKSKNLDQSEEAKKMKPPTPVKATTA